jgi:hypothetical protein
MIGRPFAGRLSRLCLVATGIGAALQIPSRLLLRDHLCGTRNHERTEVVTKVDLIHLLVRWVLRCVGCGAGAQQARLLIDGSEVSASLCDDWRDLVLRLSSSNCPECQLDSRNGAMPIAIGLPVESEYIAMRLQENQVGPTRRQRSGKPPSVHATD